MAQHLENLFEHNFNYIMDEEWVMMVEFHPFFNWLVD